MGRDADESVQGGADPVFKAGVGVPELCRKYGAQATFYRATRATRRGSRLLCWLPLNEERTRCRTHLDAPVVDPGGLALAVPVTAICYLMLAARRCLLAGLTHLDISSSGENTDFLDAWLSERGLTRRIALRAPYLSAMAILSRSDLAATLSRRIAQEFVRTDRLQIHELPVKSPVVHTTMLWHRRLDNHPAHRWLRDRIIAATKNL